MFSGVPAGADAILVELTVSVIAKHRATGNAIRRMWGPLQSDHGGVIPTVTHRICAGVTVVTFLRIVQLASSCEWLMR